MNWPNFDSSLGCHFNFFDSNSHLFSRLRDESLSSNILFEEQHQNNPSYVLDNALNFHEISQYPSAFPSPLPQANRQASFSQPQPNELHLARYRTGLKDLAKLLIKLIRSNQPVSQGQIVHFIESNLNCIKQEQLDESKKNEKNIKRRIYDALNVMISAGLLVRDNNHIAINPPPTLEIYYQRFQQKVTETKGRIEKKKQLLSKLKIQKKALNFWLKQNQKKSLKTMIEKIPFPLIFVVKSQSQIEMGWNEELFLIRNKGLQFYSQTDIIEKIYQIEQSDRHILQDVTLELSS